MKTISKSNPGSLLDLHLLFDFLLDCWRFCVPFWDQGTFHFLRILRTVLTDDLDLLDLSLIIGHDEDFDLCPVFLHDLALPDDENPTGIDEFPADGETDRDDAARTTANDASSDPPSMAPPDPSSNPSSNPAFFPGKWARNGLSVEKGHATEGSECREEGSAGRRRGNHGNPPG